MCRFQQHLSQPLAHFFCIWPLLRGPSLEPNVGKSNTFTDARANREPLAINRANWPTIRLYRSMELLATRWGCVLVQPEMEF
jgi:hypothetical protein